MEIIPVIDIKKGIAVAGKSGERARYKPLKSIFSDKEGDAIAIAEALPFKRIYIADLDAIEHGVEKANFEILEEICRIKSVILDPGIRSEEDLKIFELLRATPVIGSETVESFDAVEKAVKKFRNAFFSIDIKNRRVISKFLPESPSEAYKEICKSRIKDVIFLNISAVGTLKADFYFLDDALKIKKIKRTRIFLGGGIDKGNIENFKRKKVDGLLIGRALHSGEI